MSSKRIHPSHVSEDIFVEKCIKFFRNNHILEIPETISKIDYFYQLYLLEAASVLRNYAVAPCLSAPFPPKRIPKTITSDKNLFVKLFMQKARALAFNRFLQNKWIERHRSGLYIVSKLGLTNINAILKG